MSTLKTVETQLFHFDELRSVTEGQVFKDVASVDQVVFCPQQSRSSLCEIRRFF